MRRKIRILIAVLLLVGTHSSSKAALWFFDIGYGEAKYQFLQEDRTEFSRGLVDLEAGLLRPISPGGSLRIGSSLGLMLTPDRAIYDSYSLISVDVLRLDYKPDFPIRGRVGFGLIRAYAPVHELALGLSGAILFDAGPVAVGFKGRFSRFEVDFEPNGTPPDTKYEVTYLGMILSRSFGDEKTD